LVEEGAFAVHGLSNDFLADKPVFLNVLADFMAFIDGAEVIIHNAPFDVKFINYELSLAKQKWRVFEKHCRVTDTLVMARQLHVGQRNSLDALCRRYHVDNTHRELHGALLDAHLLGLVYLAMTGGQGSLFDMLDEPLVEEENNIVNEQITSVKRKRHLIVLKATDEELAAHAQAGGF
jgi:DNA polymerase-3 subunit epsilon